ncbi:MAG: hypothetical protein QGF07_00670, partial [Phycisphaerales bacterium]|nr:hypothetical protein [Phycisphaerales bacterium]
MANINIELNRVVKSVLQELEYYKNELEDAPESLDLDNFGEHIDEIHDACCADFFLSVYQGLTFFTMYEFQGCPEIEEQIAELKSKLYNVAVQIVSGGLNDDGVASSGGDEGPDIPDTFAPEISVRQVDLDKVVNAINVELLTEEFPEQTILSKIGYKVGMYGASIRRQRELLKAFMQANLLNVAQADQLRWGAPDSEKRRDAIVKHHRSQIALSKRRTSGDYSVAIKHWEDNIE